MIAQGIEAGGHRGMFLSDDIATQVGLFALLPQVVDAMKVPVIATGAIGDARGIVAALAMGAAGVQIGTAFLFCPEAKVLPPYRAALRTARDNSTVLTNVLSGRPHVASSTGPFGSLGPSAMSRRRFRWRSLRWRPCMRRHKSKGLVIFHPCWRGRPRPSGVNCRPAL